MSADRPDRPDGPDAWTIAELKVRLANYRQTRRLSARSLHVWCDLLIAQTERELHRLRDGCPDSPADSPPPGLPGDDRKWA